MTTTENSSSRSYSVPEFTMGDRIRRARMNAGLKQQDIEDETGISRNSVTAWEHDARMPSAALLRVLANYLHVPVEWIIQGTTPTGTSTVAYVEPRLCPDQRASPTTSMRERAGGRTSVARGSRPASYPTGRVKPRR